MLRWLAPISMLMATTALADAPRVATDIAPVHSLVSQVMKGVGEPDLIIPPSASPHGYAMRPSEARALSNAQLVVTVGHALTPWLEEPIENLAGEAVKLELMDISGMTLLSYREGDGFEAHDHDHGHGHGHDDHDDHDDHAEHDEHDHDKHDDHDHAKHEDDHDDHDHAKEEGHDHDDHDHAKHDDHDDHDEHDHAAHGEGETDPHIWLDPANGATALAAIAETLSEIDPENAATYQANAAEGQAVLATLTAEVQATVAPAAGKPFIVFHDAYQYFEGQFGLAAVASVLAGDAATPGAARMTELRDQVADAAAVCAFSEPQMNQGLLNTVVEGQGTKIAVLDPLGVDLPLGPDHYPTLLRNMAESLANCLTE